ncbi:MAG: transcriptional regulator, LysR family [Candidatus Angelobacter sp.]|nr:transcriptional regulator, LysR family [Candidatus Angelobacter sp.]
MVAPLRHALLSLEQCLSSMGVGMELRHLRYFLAVAEAGSLTVAAVRKLHTSQPSLSRQIRDLEDEVGARLLTRRARGIELTPAGRAFLDHARSVLSQVEAAGEAARRTARPPRPCFTMGFLTGHELRWMPEAMRILRDELPHIDVMISSQYSPLLADGLAKGRAQSYARLLKFSLFSLLGNRQAPFHSRQAARKSITQRMARPARVTVALTQ